MTRRNHSLQVAFAALSIAIIPWIWIRNFKAVNHEFNKNVNQRLQLPRPLRTQKRPKKDNIPAALPAQTNSSAHRSERKPSAVVEFHSVFSTGCSTFQDWQSYAFFVHALKSGQAGHVTRVASGCGTAEAQTLQRVFDEQIASMAPGRFHLHLTPDYSKLVKPSYKFFNKPMGLRHWMEEGLGFPHNGSHNNTLFIIFDPDQFIVRPFTQNYSQELWNTQDNVYTRVKPGQPMAQQYAFGANWIPKINMTYILGSPDIPSPVRSWTRNDVLKHYVVGPPYVAIGSDMYKIVKTWAELAVPVYNLTENHLSEMFAYSVAAAHAGLPHQISHSFMLSDIGSGSDEAWPWIDHYSNTQVCDPHLEPLPHVLHYCQRYFIGPWFFSKYKIPKSESQNFLSCEHPLLAEAPSDIADKYNTSTTPNGELNRLNPLQRKRMAFLICQLLPRLNEAAIFYKQHHCDATANYNKTFMFERDK